MTTAAAPSTIQAPADGDFYKYGLKPVLGEGIMDATLKRLGTVQVKAMDKSNFVKPQSVMYELDGKSLRPITSLSLSFVHQFNRLWGGCVFSVTPQYTMYQ